MIRETLEQLEGRGSELAAVGLDANAKIEWRQTAAELLASIARWQAYLRSQAVGPGDRVGIDVARGPDLLPAHLAVLALGACVVPLNPSLAPSEREQLLERAQLGCLLSQDSRPAAPGKLELVPPPSSDAPALLIFTSGTTGEPKGVPHTLAGLQANLDGLATMWGLTAGERLLHVLPAHHVHGLVLALYGSAKAGMPIYLAPRFETQACLAALEHHAIHVCMGVPTMLHRLSRAERVPDLPQLRLFTSGSAPLSSEDFYRFQAAFGQRPLERYGLTETLIVSSNPLHRKRRAGTVGHPLPHTEIRLASDGEILVRSPSVLPGYWNAPEATASAMHDGFFATGDLGHFDSDGYLVISGRKKELIIVGGSNVLPGEIERALAGDPEVDELAAVGIPDRDRGESVALCVVLTPAGDPKRVEGRLREKAVEHLARYKQPSVYRFLPALPRNSMGKIDRRALRGGLDPA